MTRRIRILGLVAFLVLAGAASGQAADDIKKCVVTTQGKSPVAEACAQGGIDAARKKMKEMVKTAKAKGVKFDCDNCHHEGKTEFDLTKNAKEDFKKLLAAVAEPTKETAAPAKAAPAPVKSVPAPAKSAPVPAKAAPAPTKK